MEIILEISNWASWDVWSRVSGVGVIVEVILSASHINIHIFISENLQCHATPSTDRNTFYLLIYSSIL